MSEPLVEGRLALRRAEALILAGKHVRHKEVQEYGLPDQWSEDIAVAPAVVYRLRRKADVIALYESARSAWRDGVEGVFSVAE